MIIGVLALQGDFAEHRAIFTGMGIETREVRLPEQLTDLAGLVIPGGESTTIGKLARAFDMLEPLRQFGARHPIWGTCAGAIFLSKDANRDQPLLGLMDIQVERNAFGRQVDSFETDLDVTVFENGSNSSRPFPAVFIRAPRLVNARGETEILSTLADGTAVAAQEGRWLVTAFHPELTGDDRFHRYFIEMVEQNKMSEMA